MIDLLKELYEASSLVDLIYLIITILSLIKCYNKGFVLSILSMAKWLLAYVITLIIFPKVKPYFKDVIDSEYVLDIGLGVTIFVVVIFLVLLINKGISKAVRYTGIGGLDTLFGFFFGFVRAYIICLIIFLSIIFGKIETCASKDSLKALPNSLIFISFIEFHTLVADSDSLLTNLSSLFILPKTS